MTLAVLGIFALAASACGDDEAVRERCGAGASRATTTVNETTPSTTPPTTQPTDTALSIPSFSRTVLLQGLTFTLPPELRYRTDGFNSSGESIDAYYANVPLGSACSNGCDLPSFNPLPPNAVVVGFGLLSGFGVGAPNPNDPAPNTSIAGRTAVFKADKPGECGGDETIKFWIPAPGQDGINDLLIRACLKGPDLATAEQVVRTLLESATSAAGS